MANMSRKERMVSAGYCGLWTVITTLLAMMNIVAWVRFHDSTYRWMGMIDVPVPEYTIVAGIGAAIVAVIMLGITVREFVKALKTKD